jgi:hypothetical protein
MSLSREWTEWHLTPRGWERGSEKVDGGGGKDREAPEDRVLTVRWREEQETMATKMERWHHEDWRSVDEAEVKRLTKQFGSAPESL